MQQNRVMILCILGCTSKCVFGFNTLATVCFALATLITIPMAIETHFPPKLVTHS